MYVQILLFNKDSKIFMYNLTTNSIKLLYLNEYI